MPSQSNANSSINPSVRGPNNALDTRNKGIERVAKRLEEAGLYTKRFCEIHEGKAGYDYDRLYRFDEVPSLNYGVRGQDDLVIVDVDDWGETPKEIRKLIHEKPTFTVETPHSDRKGGHYYFKCDEPVPQKAPPWGDIKTGVGHVVGPGSKIEKCRKDSHDCSLPGEGYYILRHDRPIASISPSELPTKPKEDYKNPAGDKTDPTFSGDIQRRLDEAVKNSPNLRDLWQWAYENGNPAEVGFPGDNSRAECRLAAHLAYWFEKDKSTVRMLINEANPPKWAERGQRYHESVLEAVDLQPDQYHTNRKESGPSQELVIAVLFDLLWMEKASTAEVAESVEYGAKQTRKALNWLRDKGIVNYQREGRSGHWMPTGRLIPEGLNEEVDSELNSIEKRDEYLMERNLERFGQDARVK